LNNFESGLDEVGALLDEQWMIKRQLSDSVSNEAIDEIYSRGVSAGATGGKLLGAGGGGLCSSMLLKRSMKTSRLPWAKKCSFHLGLKALGHRLFTIPTTRSIYAEKVN
jgi:galactokinase/mevalonate kinase-like predicted kinase